MQTFIQSQQTKCYFDYETKSWKPARKDATAFDSAAEAIRACLRHSLTTVQFVFREEEKLSGWTKVPFGDQYPHHIQARYE